MQLKQQVRSQGSTVFDSSREPFIGCSCCILLNATPCLLLVPGQLCCMRHLPLPLRQLLMRRKRLQEQLAAWHACLELDAGQESPAELAMQAVRFVRRLVRGQEQTDLQLIGLGQNDWRLG
jgi:hypothetical protein